MEVISRPSGFSSSASRIFVRISNQKKEKKKRKGTSCRQTCKDFRIAERERERERFSGGNENQKCFYFAFSVSLQMSQKMWHGRKNDCIVSKYGPGLDIYSNQ